ncbi:hypothetical protein DSO57_1020429 [Entomophthora muscae]|uniref:Uncharacterized protein n=1 Tax=Entomophthora muscae TaxID=34485 RepID=A0ACC2RUQ7_9FUNG|nr:hypothetical protein DSO57_1020429 [Entomophthora muscae]
MLPIPKTQAKDQATLPIDDIYGLKQAYLDGRKTSLQGSFRDTVTELLGLRATQTNENPSSKVHPQY